jgi:DNA-binding Lrp family transcriptional regulator
MRTDEKTRIILEELNEKGSLTQPSLYEATKPTTYPALQKRLDVLKEAGLIDEGLGERHFRYYNITNFGVQVSIMLDVDKNLDL